ncbi:MAG: hypothetical protein NW202_13535 [Nitrospira sp.]|nr:hypothetical protein [Nitrospira sp.]
MSSMGKSFLIRDLVFQASAAMGIAAKNIAYTFSHCLEAVGNPAAMAPLHTAGGSAVQLTAGADSTGGVFQTYTATGGTDIGCVYGNRSGRASDHRKLFCAARIKFVGTAAAGAYSMIGWSDDSGIGTLGSDQFTIGQIHAGSATNIVLLKGNAGTPTYVDTGVSSAAGTWRTVKFGCNEGVVTGSVDSTQFSTTVTGIGTSANEWLPSWVCGNGGVTAARNLYADWVFWASKASEG